jgi:ATP-dependent exoDNAse (exonuclease V) alpha subunit
LTVHKTQGLTLPHVTVSVDESMFAVSQIYVAMSRATSWETIYILSFDYEQIKIPDAALKEYYRLNQLHSAGLQSLLYEKFFF